MNPALTLAAMAATALVPLCALASSPQAVARKMEALSSALSVSPPPPAVSEKASHDWERLPDGRVVIEIFDHKLAFATHGDALSGAEFDFEGIDQKDLPFRRLMSGVPLGELMTFYKEAQEAIHKTEEEGISIRLMLNPDSINPKDHPVFDFKGRMPDQQSWIQFYPRPFGGSDYVAPPCKSSGEADEDGFVLEKETPNERVYCAPAESRLFKSNHPLRIGCWTPHREWNSAQCHLPNYINTSKKMNATYQFSGIFNSETKRFGFTKDQWRALDKRVHDFLTHLIISETAESIQ